MDDRLTELERRAQDEKKLQGPGNAQQPEKPQQQEGPPRPTLGRIVLYRSTTTEEVSIEPQVGERVAYELPAIVTAVEASLWGKAVAEGHVRDLSDDMHVHLTVFTCGDATLGGNSGGTYQEFNVRYSEDKEPGTWTWPQRG